MLSVRRGSVLSVLVMSGAVLLSAVLAGCEAVRSVTSPVPEPAPLPLFREEPEIRVRIHKDWPKTVIGGVERLAVRPVGAMRADIFPGPIEVTSSARGIRVTPAGGQAREYPAGSALEIQDAAGPSTDGPAAVRAALSETLVIDNVRYPGFVTIRPNWSGNAAVSDVIVTMGIESYIPGVLTHELWPNWPRQTFEAQAVAARTYALFERERARGMGRVFDVEDTEADQVFGGATTRPMPIEATRATRGRVVVWRGGLLRAYYSSQCGGRSASAADVWPTGVGYEFNRATPLQGQSRQAYCQASPLYRWSVERSDDDVSTRLRTWGRAFNHEVAGIGRLRNVELERANSASRPSRYRLTDDRGRTFSMTAEEFRMGCNQNVPDLPPITRETRVSSGDVVVDVWGDRVRFTGRGWGHGVGMCQWCAKGMADAGLDWATMLERFYPGAEVRKAY